MLLHFEVSDDKNRVEALAAAAEQGHDEEAGQEDRGGEAVCETA